MARYFITLAYDGTNYHGWQIQPNANSVQEELNKAFSTILRKKIEVVGAGRTDTGVHASKMIAHFNGDIENCEKLIYKLNRLLPPDISISNIQKTIDSAHARFDAIKRTYNYFVYNKKDPFKRHFASRLIQDTNFKLMNEAAKILIETSDFTSFSKLHTDTKTNICRISEAKWTEISPNYWVFEISADRFLRNMVRAIVGTLLWVGQGKISIEDFKNIIQKKDRCSAGDSVSANALFLVEITYPQNIYL